MAAWRSSSEREALAGVLDPARNHAVRANERDLHMLASVEMRAYSMAFRGTSLKDLPLRMRKTHGSGFGESLSLKKTRNPRV